MIGGVCNGIAAFFDIDVTLVRVIFAALAAIELASSHVGAIVIAYIVMMFVVPLAGTSEEQAAAHGIRFNAQEVIDRAKRNIAHINDRGWRRQQRVWRRQRRQWTRQWRHTTRFQGPWPGWAPVPPSADYGTRVAAGIMTSLLAVADLLLFLVFLYGLISLLSTGGIYTWRLPANVPLWLATMGLFFTYYVVAWPLHMARRAAYYAVGGSMYGWDAGGYGLDLGRAHGPSRLARVSARAGSSKRRPAVARNLGTRQTGICPEQSVVFDVGRSGHPARIRRARSSECSRRTTC